MKRLHGCYDPFWKNRNEVYFFKFFIFLEVFDLMLFESKEKFETKKEITNSAIRICIECGSLAVLIDNHLIFCNDCNSKFEIKDDD